MTAKIAPRRCAALLLLCLVAQVSPAVPLDDVPGQPEAITEAEGADKAIPASPALGGGLSHAALFRVGDASEQGGDGAPVAEPSTLLLVSLGLFGLIAWSRWRR